MLKEIIIILLLATILVILFVIFSARDLFAKKAKKNDENTIVTGVKVAGYFVCVIILAMLYFLKN